MKTAAMHSWLLPCLLGVLTLATPALAQRNTSSGYPDDDKSGDSEPVPARRRRVQPQDKPDTYPDEDTETSRPSSRRRPTRSLEDTEKDFRHADEDEPKRDYKRLAGLDDPNTGIAFEVLGGVMGLSSPRGQLLGDLLPSVGGRFTWEYGRLLNEETLREALWLDLRYSYVGERNGTQLIVGDTRVHYATLAPAYELTFGEGSDYGAYVQVGGGVAYERTTVEVGGKVTEANGIKPLIQYGIGLRGRTQLSSESNLRLSWRVELTRFRRGYMDDLYAGVSVGLAF